MATKPVEAVWAPREEGEESLFGQRVMGEPCAFVWVFETGAAPGTPTRWRHWTRLFSPAAARVSGMEAPLEERVSHWEALRARQLEMRVRAYENAVRWQQRQNAELRGRVERLEAQVRALIAEEQQWGETQRLVLQDMGVASWEEAEAQLALPDGQPSALDELFAEMTPEEWDDFVGES